MLGNELKVGDVILCQTGGLTRATITKLTDGGLTAIIPGTKQAMVLPGVCELTMEPIEVQYDTTKPIGIWKVVVPKEDQNNKVTQ